MSTGRRQKVFCIGFNKTGTTSIGAALAGLGFDLAEQTPGERLLEDWGRRDFTALLRFCEQHDAFQDVPFSLPSTFEALDAAFPGSKFILSERNSAETWFRSMTQYHTKVVGKKRLPTPQDLREYGHCYRGWLWRAMELVYGADEQTAYHKDRCVRAYLAHGEHVRAHFRQRPDDLLVLDVATKTAMTDICRFLNIPYDGRPMPHLNAT
jgi:hypothetical protein